MDKVGRYAPRIAGNEHHGDACRAKIAGQSEGFAVGKQGIEDGGLRRLRRSGKTRLRDRPDGQRDRVLVVEDALDVEADQRLGLRLSSACAASSATLSSLPACSAMAR